jgi:hypothetical protein
MLKKIAKIAVLTMVLLSMQATNVLAEVGITDTPIGKDTTINLPKIGAKTSPDSTSPILTAEESFGVIMEKIATYLFMFAGAVAIFYILQAGFTLIRARGDEETVKKGHQMLIWSVVGFLLVLVSYSLVINVAKIIYGMIEGRMI